MQIRNERVVSKENLCEDWAMLYCKQEGVEGVVFGEGKCSTCPGQLQDTVGESTTVNGRQQQMQEAASAATVVMMKISSSHVGEEGE